MATTEMQAAELLSEISCDLLVDLVNEVYKDDKVTFYYAGDTFEEYYYPNEGSIFSILPDKEDKYAWAKEDNETGKIEYSYLAYDIADCGDGLIDYNRCVQYLVDNDINDEEQLVEHLNN